MHDTAPVRKIELSYTWSGQSGERLIRNALMDLLYAVQETGSISAAAKRLGLSYRHVWGELKRWEVELGQALIVWEKGQPARLATFGVLALVGSATMLCGLGAGSEPGRSVRI